MASMNTRLNIKTLNGNIIQNHGGSKQVGFKQLGPDVETRVYGVHDEKRVWFEVELQVAQGDRKAERSTQQCMKSEVAKHLGVVGIQQQNGFVDETNVTLFAKLARDREQHLACELFGYREDSNEAGFTVVVVEKVYAHESLTFNNIVACEVISKWKVRLKDGMDARSDVWLEDKQPEEKTNTDCLRSTQQCMKSEVAKHLGVAGIQQQNGFVDETNVTLFAKEYQMVCTRLDIASVDVGMLDKFDRGLQTDVQVFVDFDYVMGRSITVMGYMTFIEAWKKEIWLKGLLAESKYELRLVAGIAIGALVKGGSLFEVPAQVEKNLLTGFPAQSISSSNAIALDLPNLLVLITGTSQSRQHGDKQKFSFRAGENGAIAIEYKCEPWSGKNETVTRQSLQASAAQRTARIQFRLMPSRSDPDQATRCATIDVAY
nr:zinc finger, CCHC-type [Tanacetum cinerariifolium]